MIGASVSKDFVSHQRGQPPGKKCIEFVLAPQEYWEKREALLVNERLLLQTLSFDLCIDHPYKYGAALNF